MANIIETSAGYNWDTDGVYQIEKSDPVEGGVDGVSNRQARQLAHRTRDLHARLVAVKTDLETIEGGSLDVAYDTLLKLQDKLKAVEVAINGDNGDMLIETLQEALGFINNHKTDIESLVATYVKKSVIADNLTTSNPGYVLSAQQGVKLKKLIDALTEVVAGKETIIGSEQKVAATLEAANNYANQNDMLRTPYDYIIDSNEKLAGLNNNPNATSVLIKKGTWVIPAGITLHPNTKRITGEVGSIIKAGGNNTRGCLGYEFRMQLAAPDYRIDNVTVENSYNRWPCFKNMVNMTNCVGINSAPFENARCDVFFYCINLLRCSGKIGVHFGATGVFSDCANVVQCCDCSEDEDIYSFSSCEYVLQCIGNVFSQSSYVSYCKAKRFSSVNAGNGDTEHVASDTMIGGWNKTYH